MDQKMSLQRMKTIYASPGEHDNWITLNSVLHKILWQHSWKLQQRQVVINFLYSFFQFLSSCIDQ